tara:strand:+ start:240 stop:1370 length:1131 start_codon:yes stop_codon:yes gene_type:complete
MKTETITLKKKREEKEFELSFIAGNNKVASATNFKGNIENFIGMAQVPMGLAGPIIVQGSKSKGEYAIPLATTEGALVASYSRGMKACNLSGGITSYCLRDVLQRSPFFKFDTMDRVRHFTVWIDSQMYKFVEIVARSSQFAKLLKVSPNIEGNSVILTFDYTTGDAAGQNMVTICTHQICQYILEIYDQKPVEWYIESNYSGDKKATALSFSNGRGKKVSAEVTIPKKVVKEVLKSTPEGIVAYWKSSTLAVVQSGAIGAQGHVANALTALFIACGQDVACIAESSTGITRMELTQEGDLYVAVTLPSLVVGTVGGGTGLPTQRECLEIMSCYGEGKAIKFAEICCAVALAGEISIAAAMSADHFAQAHKALGRK